MAAKPIRVDNPQSVRVTMPVETPTQSPPAHYEVAHNQPRHEEVAARAYMRWQERGCPEGSAEQDWFQAEEELRSTSDAG